ncbi:MAG: antitermination protein NusG [Methylobacterium sp.]|uniref:transcription termination/antitermination protein NusG n=1 Tax=Methylobacterium sp. TaxID=409 RepID=UPI0025863E01|nr:antitermination protein NusG [Methylobacterium sp.]MBY0296395.1 antitermination protein NusG [Methylobacterium sp.]
MSSKQAKLRLSSKRRKRDKRRRSAEFQARGERERTAQERTERRERAQKAEAAHMERMRWHLVDCRVGKTGELVKALAEGAVPTLRLSDDVVQVRSGRVIRSRVPFFRRMLFVGLDPSIEDGHWLRGVYDREVEGVRFRDERFLTVPGSQLDRFAGTLGGTMPPAAKPKAGALTVEDFELGEQVRVADGPFASFSGVIEATDSAQQTMEVAVSIFGRSTPVTLEAGQVEKLSDET